MYTSEGRKGEERGSGGSRVSYVTLIRRWTRFRQYRRRQDLPRTGQRMASCPPSRYQSERRKSHQPWETCLNNANDIESLCWLGKAVWQMGGNSNAIWYWQHTTVLNQTMVAVGIKESQKLCKYLVQYKKVIPALTAKNPRRAGAPVRGIRPHTTPAREGGGMESIESIANSEWWLTQPLVYCNPSYWGRRHMPGCNPKCIRYTVRLQREE